MTRESTLNLLKDASDGTFMIRNASPSANTDDYYIDLSTNVASSSISTPLILCLVKGKQRDRCDLTALTQPFSDLIKARRSSRSKYSKTKATSASTSSFRVASNRFENSLTTSRSTT
jgi:hypothetical protein